MKKEQSHHAWFSGFPLQQILLGVMKSAERYDLAKMRSLAEYLLTNIVKYGVIIIKEVAHFAKKKESLFLITQIVQGLNIATSQN